MTDVEAWLRGKVEDVRLLLKREPLGPNEWLPAAQVCDLFNIEVGTLYVWRTRYHLHTYRGRYDWREVYLCKIQDPATRRRRDVTEPKKAL